MTVFELVLDSLEVRGARRVATGRAHAAPLALRVVVHEGSGDVTLTARH